MRRRRRIAIVHPWFPQYRAPFFEALLDLAADTIDIDIFYGDPPPEWNDRGDSLSRAYATHLPTRFTKVGGRSLAWKTTRELRSREPYDLIILEQAVRNLETYALIARMGFKRVAFWGHGRSYTIEASRAQEALKAWLTRRVAWFFAYTPGGADAVAGGGFPRERITIVSNAVDTSSLTRELAAVSPEASRAFQVEHDLRGKTAIFVGGLDEFKRVEFLLEAARIAHEIDPDFRILIAGNGEKRNLVAAASAGSHYVRYLGPQNGADKALSLRSAEVLAMPGRVGLIAVDSFASGLPIVTTDWAYHAPEFEYLSPGDDSVVTTNNVQAYAEGLLCVLSDPDRIAALSAAAVAKSTKYSIERMAQNFYRGIQSATEALP